MRILVTGADGQLGKALLSEGKRLGYEMVACSRRKMDITNFAEVENVITEENPEGVIHCAAWTNVDQAEIEKEECWRVNCEGTSHIVTMCRRLDIPLMYISTDYVFSGSGTAPWSEYDKREPINYYGMTKYQGEQMAEVFQRHFIVRTSWVFGDSEQNFVEKILKRASVSDELQVVCDQIGSPTYTYDLATACLQMITTECYGTYHVTNEGYCSWYEFAKNIVEQAGLKVKVIPVESERYPTKAYRPKNSRLSHEELVNRGFLKLPTWEDALNRYMKQKKSEEL